MITVCMIVKDEEKNIRESLNCLSKYDFEIVVVDTGSIDNTIKIAKEYTDKVYEYKWDNDFGKARNYSISKATNDYVLIIDADEVLIDLNYNEMIKRIKENQYKVGKIEINNIFNRNHKQFNNIERVNRVFNKNEFKFNGKIHEQIISIKGYGYETYNIPLIINHKGYTTEEINRKNKIRRNIDMLEKEIKDNPKDPYLLYQLGKSNYMGEEFAKAEQCFLKALNFDLDVKLEYVQDLVESYGYTLLKNKKYKKALELLGIYEEFDHLADFVFLIGIIYLNNNLFNEAIAEFEKCLTYKKCKISGVNSYLANYNIGVIYECIGKTKKAEEYYKKCGNYQPAIDRIKHK